MGKKTRHYTEDEFVLCPYYLREDPIQVKCVGICGTHTINVFGSSKEKEDFKYDFCCGLYHNCPLYIQLEVDGK